MGKSIREQESGPTPRRERPEIRQLPFLSVVVPVRNEETFIKSTLMQLLGQDYPEDRFEVLVVDGASTDSTCQKVLEVAQEHTQVRLLENPGIRSSSGRNIGFRAGQGEVFLVVDGHCYLAGDRLFQDIVKCLDESGADCLGRPQPLDPPGITPFQRAVGLARASPLGHSLKSYIYSDRAGCLSPVSVAAIYRRKIFDCVGYVDEEFDACEDVEFNYRIEKAGLKCYFHPMLAIRYYPRRDFRSFFRQMFRYGRGRARFVRKHPAALSLDKALLVLLVLGAVLLPPCVLLISAFSLIWCSAYAVYVLVILAESVWLSILHGWKHMRYLPLLFLTIHFGLGAGFLAGLFARPKRDVMERNAHPRVTYTP